MDTLSFEFFSYDRENSKFGGISFFRKNSPILVITYAPNFDIYFTLETMKDKNSFIIGKDNYEVYRIFDLLYKDIMMGHPYKIEEGEMTILKFEAENYGFNLSQKVSDLENRYELFRKENLNQAYASGLIDGDKIIWRSDDYAKDVAPFFIIHKRDNFYEIEFGMPEVCRSLNFEEQSAYARYKYRDQISVRLRQSGSRYIPFDVCFMALFRDFYKLDAQNHQLDLEEYNWDESLKRIRK